MKTSEDTINIQCFQKLLISPERFRQIPKWFQRKHSGKSFNSRPSFKVKVKEITNRDDLAFTIFRHLGFGEFTVCFRNIWAKNKKFNPRFKCVFQKGGECAYKNNGKCRVYSRHQKGWSCRKNPKIKPNWNWRAKIEIYPTVDGTKEYEYKMIDDRRMYWFWFYKRQR